MIIIVVIIVISMVAQCHHFYLRPRCCVVTFTEVVADPDGIAVVTAFLVTVIKVAVDVQYVQ